MQEEDNHEDQSRGPHHRKREFAAIVGEPPEALYWSESGHGQQTEHRDVSKTRDGNRARKKQQCDRHIAQAG